MKRSNNYFLLALLFVAFTACSEEKTTTVTRTPDELIAEAESLDSLFLVAFNRGDVDALMSVLWNSPELVAYPPGEMQLKGYDAIRESYVKEFTTNKGAVLAYTGTYNIPFADGVAGFGTYTWTLAVDGKAPMVVEGRYSDIKAFKDGKMVIIHDHSSAPAPPAPPAQDSTSLN
ncbi:MAG: hypothetical protein ABIQ11_01890 [Saprospiraceae bacterium]